QIFSLCSLAMCSLFVCVEIAQAIGQEGLESSEMVLDVELGWRARTASCSRVPRSPSPMPQQAQNREKRKGTSLGAHEKLRHLAPRISSAAADKPVRIPFPRPVWLGPLPLTTVACTF
ncbi:hypothetical protein B8W95_12815, partial [Staphylococcus pasteuri]